MEIKKKKQRSKSQKPKEKSSILSQITLNAKSKTMEDSLTLYQLQDKIKRMPSLYKNSFEKHWEIFKQLLIEFKQNPAKYDKQLVEYLQFFSQIAFVYKEQIIDFLSQEMINLLEQYYSILNPVVRLTLVKCLKLIRGKDLIQPQIILPVFFKLFKCKDKELREFLQQAIISDLKKINKKSKHHGVNKKLQNFIFKMLQDQTEQASKRSLVTMIELYRKKIWNDDKTVNILAEACLHTNPKIFAASLKFFLTIQHDIQYEYSDSDSDIEINQKIKEFSGKKITRHKKERIQKMVKQQKRKEKRRSKVKINTDFLPVDLIYDPQNFTDRLFTKLRRSNDRYECKQLMMRMISRLIGRHKLQIFQYYQHLLRYMQSYDKEKIGEMFAMIIEACHDLVPPEEIKPLINKMIQIYISEYSDNQHITLGLNTIRMILMRMPLALDESQIEFLIQFNDFKNNSVRQAAKSLINYFRDVCPQLLPKKYRGRFTKVEDEQDRKDNYMVFGQEKIFYDIDGIELLKQAENHNNQNLAADKILDDKDFKKIKFLKLQQSIQKEPKSQLPQEDPSLSDNSSQDLLEDSESEISENDYPNPTTQQPEPEPSYHSSDLNQSSEEEDPHGFVYSYQLDTFKKPKKERMQEQREQLDKEAHRDKFKRKREKKGGKSNRENLKNKPFMMVKNKKLDSIQESYNKTKTNVKHLKRQLGKFRKSQKQKLASKRRKLK